MYNLHGWLLLFLVIHVAIHTKHLININIELDINNTVYP
ncbi:hypothetical protein SDC9_75963 [bioreactor metagenome]|uniref:Uncharacterized protein n=1 Tax=bioreactor metagenome TaxID=1076179 RepID=A0A644YSH7_9ZZZZ